MSFGFKGQLEEQKARYGDHLFERDAEGSYSCFFLNCDAKPRANIARSDYFIKKSILISFLFFQYLFL